MVMHPDTYQVIRHPKSGELYAVHLDGVGTILRCGGPLHHSDPTDAESIRDYLDNQDPEDVAADAPWLEDALQGRLPF